MFHQGKETFSLQPKKFIEIAFLGIISGIPFSVLYTVLITWLTESNIALSTITTLSVSRISYGFKYLWAPLIDNINIPFLGNLGRRKSWMFLSIFVLACLMLLIAFTKPNDSFNLILYIAILFGFVSATYDIAFDAYRIDNIDSEKQGYASACAVMGYRIGMIISSSGALIISSFIGWQMTFISFAIIFALSLLYIPLLNENEISTQDTYSLEEKISLSVVEPFRDFLSKKNAALILVAIILYKLGGVLLGFVSLPFYLYLGYTKIQVAAIVKFIGLLASIFGSFIGGYIISKLGILRGLIICGVIQAFVHGTFIWLHYAPVENFSLLITIVAENIGSAAGSTAEVAYISHLCNKKYSATQYALLSSMAGLMNSLISIKSGGIIANVGWDLFFCLTVILSLPAIIILVFLKIKETRLA